MYTSILVRETQLTPGSTGKLEHKERGQLAGSLQAFIHTDVVKLLQVSLQLQIEMMIKHCTAQHRRRLLCSSARFIQKLLTSSIPCAFCLRVVQHGGYWSQCHQLFPDSSLLNKTLRPRSAGQGILLFRPQLFRRLLSPPPFDDIYKYIFYDGIEKERSSTFALFFSPSQKLRCERPNLFLLIFSDVYNQKGFWRRAGEMMETDCIWFPVFFFLVLDYYYISSLSLCLLLRFEAGEEEKGRHEPSQLFPGCPLEPIPSNHHVNQNCHRYKP